MTKYIRKPEIVEAVLFDGSNYDEIGRFTGFDAQIRGREKRLEIKTLEGIMDAEPGDYIIKGVQGEFYPCKPDVFDFYYKRAE